MKRRLIALALAFSAAFGATGCQASPSETTPPETTATVPVEPVTLPSASVPEDPTGYRVAQPMAYPDYGFQEEPSVMDLRMTAVRAMRDTLSVQWSTIDGIRYYKTGPVSQKYFQHEPDTTYAGVLYSNASTGIIQFMEYYDQQTGRLLFPGDSEQIKRVLGSSCADCLIWGWNTVCTTISGAYYPNTMLYCNGYIPVGDYTYDFSITNFNQEPTYAIIENNGNDVILDAYTQVQPADALVSSSDNHGMMVIDYPHVEYTEDGSIDLEKSYVTIQDQRGGTGPGFYEQEVDGQVLLFSGRTEATYTFQTLLDKHFIPVTTAEFAGLKAYETPWVTASAETVSSLEELLATTVSSNYPLAVVNVWVEDHLGNQLLIDRKTFGGADDAGVPKEFTLSGIRGLQSFATSQYNVKTLTLRIEVVTASGARFTPVSYTI